MLRTQTLDTQTHTERGGYEVPQDAYVSGAEERDILMIYTRL